MLLSELIKECDQYKSDHGSIPEVEINGIQSDSRNINPGDLFVALEGGLADGHNFIDAAISKGAAAVIGRKPLQSESIPYFQVENPRETLAFLAASFFGHPARKLTIIGVTGTDGKTTTVNLIYQILLACGIKAGMISTVNAVIGNDVLDTGFHVTTPDAMVIQNYLGKMVNQGITHVVLETTSHGLAQYRVTACEFDVGVITNITHEHLDYHGSYGEYFNAKMRLVDELNKTVKKRNGNPRLAILNRDDCSYSKITEKLINQGYSQINKIDYGFSNDAMVRSYNVTHNDNGLSFDIDILGQIRRVISPLIGQYNVHNILAALAASVVGLNLDLDCALGGIKAMSGVPGRMERINLGQDFLAIVDFAHTPNALKVALQTARQMTTGKIIAVFGSAGLRDRETRRLMAAVSLIAADISILTAEDPRTENLKGILLEMADEADRNGGKLNINYYVIEDRGEAIQKAVSIAKKGDLVIACGKGHEQSMCFDVTEYPWDDRTAMRAALAERLGVSGPKMPWLPTRKK